MGILPKHLHLLALEKQNNKKSSYIYGDALVLGQQAVYADLPKTREIFQSHGLNTEELPKGFDVKNKIPQWKSTAFKENINVHTVLKLLGADKVSVTDVSDYENPDFIFNLNDPIDDKYKNRFDLIFDVGTLEHIFDVFTTLSNIVRMTKVGGRVIFINPASNAINHGFYSFSPTIFYDFFDANGFEGGESFLLEGSPHDYFKKGSIYKLNNKIDENTFLSSSVVETYFTAVKKYEIKNIVKPIQSIYKKSSYWSNSTSLSDPVSIIRKDKIKFLFKKILRVFPNFFCNWLYMKLRKKGSVTYIGKY